MNLLKMSLSGGVLILVIAIIRAMAKNRLPKRAFTVLWTMAVIRLLIPFSVPADFSVYSMIGQSVTAREALESVETALGFSPVSVGAEEKDGVWEVLPDTGKQSGEEISPDTGKRSGAEILPDTGKSSGAEVLPDAGKQAGAEILFGTDAEKQDAFYALPQSVFNNAEGNEANFLPWLVLYLAGVISIAVFWTVSYWKCLQRFKMSLPMKEGYGTAWLKEHPLKRMVTIRQSDMIATPLTYGILRPVILMPKNVDWENREQLDYILMHEYVHIRWFDQAAKLAGVTALCIHWFNPLVWIMYILFNRDIELSCDESVVKAFGENAKALYANTLIAMEERKSGLVPFYSSFSKNAMEERIRAIMKIKKTSIAAVVFTVILIAGVAALFATSAKPAPYGDSLKEALKQIPGEEFTKEESEKLFSLWIDGYERMSVADYRKKMHQIVDEPEMLRLVERFLISEQAYEIKNDKEAEALEAFTDYCFYVFAPLTAEKWETREFSGYAADSVEGAPVDPAVFEYSFTLHIIHPENLKTEEYNAVRRETDDVLCNILNGYTTKELCDEEKMRKSLNEQISLLEEKISTENLRVEVNDYYFRPISEEILEDLALHDAANEESRALWAETLSPYTPFGLDWTYLPGYDGGDVKMTWQGKEVRGIMDEEEGVLITAHTGLLSYSTDAVELYAVYENGKLTGLRFADEEEMAEFTEARKKAETEKIETEKKAETGDEIERQGKMEIRERAEEEREKAIELQRMASGYGPGTEDDYKSLLTLMAPGYENMSVAEFNDSLLEWVNENFESHERICQDVGLDDYHVRLSGKEKEFLSLTVMLSDEENFIRIKKLYSEALGEVCYYGNQNLDKSEEGVWCYLWYQMRYCILDEEGLSVKERDQCISGIRKDVEEFWSKTDLERLLFMSEEDVTEQLNAIAAAHSNECITVAIMEDDVQFEKMDERRYLY